jgi:hypothetical protein
MDKYTYRGGSLVMTALYGAALVLHDQGKVGDLKFQVVPSSNGVLEVETTADGKRLLDIVRLKANDLVRS